MYNGRNNSDKQLEKTNNSFSTKLFSNCFWTHKCL